MQKWSYTAQINGEFNIFIHYKDLYSASSRGVLRSSPNPQRGQITQAWVVEGMFDSGFWEVIGKWNFSKKISTGCGESKFFLFPRKLIIEPLCRPRNKIEPMITKHER